MTNNRLARAAMTKQYVPRHHQHSRRTKTALNPVQLVKIPAQTFHYLVIPKAFDRSDRTAITHHSENNTGSGSPAVHFHSAGAARTVLASKMGAGETTMLTYQFGEHDSRLNRNRAFNRIHRDGYSLHCARASRIARITVAIWQRR
jgi:hypothetical protein